MNLQGKQPGPGVATLSYPLADFLRQATVTKVEVLVVDCKIERTHGFMAHLCAANRVDLYRSV